MIISLDFDNTYTADPELWYEFAHMALNRGHRVVIVTKREPTMAVNLPFPTIYTSRTKKRPHMPEGTIWIDDSPEGILFDDKDMVCS